VEQTTKASPPGKIATYKYVALDAHSKLVKGTVKAPSEAIAGRLITERGLRPVSVEIRPSQLSLEQAFPSFFGIKPREVVSFSRQLATLIEAGIPLTAGLELMYEQTTNRGFKRVLATIVEDLRSGVSLSTCLVKHPTAFSEVFCKTISLAESTGNLEAILRQMADFQEKQETATKKVKGALTYPAVIFVVGIVVGIILMTTALPAMIDMFKEMDIALPLPTQILIAISDFFNTKILFIGMFLGILVVLGIYMVKSPAARLRLDGWLLRAPVIGPPTHAAVLARFSRTTSILLSAGLSLQEIMELTPSTIGNQAMSKSLSAVAHELVRGEGLAAPMSKDDLFPPLLTQMVMVGEESNTLHTSLAVSADFYEQQSEEKLTAMVRVIQPAATLIIAGLVAFMAIAVILPMYSITGSFE